MRLFDTHCHLNFRAYSANSDEVFGRARTQGVGLNIVGSQRDTSRRAVALAEQYEGDVYATVGLHPVHLVDEEIEEEGGTFRTRAEIFDYEAYKVLAAHPRVVAIGEMGLDYYRLPRDGEGVSEIKAKQRVTFEQGLSLASELDKAIVVHTRPSPGTVDAYQDVIEILDSRFKISDQRVRGVVHCFGGNLEQARRIIELGLYIGVTGIVTFKNAKELQEIVREIPLDHLVIETDAPYLAPDPYRGQRNEPAYVEHVARKIADIKDMAFDEIARITTENGRNLFALK